MATDYKIVVVPDISTIYKNNCVCTSTSEPQYGLQYQLENTTPRNAALI